MSKIIDFKEEIERKSFEAYLRMVSPSVEEAERLIKLTRKEKQQSNKDIRV